MLCARARRPKNAGPYEDAGDQRPAPEQRGEVMTGCGAKPAKLPYYRPSKNYGDGVMCGQLDPDVRSEGSGGD